MRNDRLAELLHNAGVALTDRPGHEELAQTLKREAAYRLPRGGHAHEVSGVWVTHYSDWSAFTVFETEIDALREAVNGGTGDLVTYVPYGEPVRDYVTQARTPIEDDQELI